MEEGVGITNDLRVLLTAGSSESVNLNTAAEEIQRIASFPLGVKGRNVGGFNPRVCPVFG